MAAAALRRQGARRLVLIVEDDADLSASVASSLVEAGYSVEEIADGQEAYDRLVRGKRPDLVLLDLLLPGKSGWELLGMLRRSTTLVNVPVVVFSAHSGLPPAGAVAWLRKPVRNEVLIRTIDDVLERGS